MSTLNENNFKEVIRNTFTKDSRKDYIQLIKNIEDMKDDLQSRLNGLKETFDRKSKTFNKCKYLNKYRWGYCLLFTALVFVVVGLVLPILCSIKGIEALPPAGLYKTILVVDYAFIVVFTCCYFRAVWYQGILQDISEEQESLTHKMERLEVIQSFVQNLADLRVYETIYDGVYKMQEYMKNHDEAGYKSLCNAAVAIGFDMQEFLQKKE